MLVSFTLLLSPYSPSQLHISRPLNPLMSSFFLIHTGWGQKSGTNGAWGVSLYSQEALIIVKRVFCYVLRFPHQKHDQFNLHRKARKNLATSSWWHIKLKCLKCNRGPLPSTWGPRVLSYNLQSIFKTIPSSLKWCEQRGLTANSASFSPNTSPTSPRLRFQPLLVCGASSCSWQKKHIAHG